LDSEQESGGCLGRATRGNHRCRSCAQPPHFGRRIGDLAARVP